MATYASEAFAPAVCKPEPRSYLSVSIRVWVRFLLFVVTISTVTALPVYVIDPYGLLGSTLKKVPEEVKRAYAQSIDDPLWKLPLYDKNPAENILLGDSQMEHLAPQDIAEISGGARYFNLAYGGGTLRESISTFWHAASKVRLRSVYFGVTFMAYNANQADRAAAADNIERHPLAYFYDPAVLQTTLYDVLSLIPGGQVSIGPGMGQDEFWQVQLDSVGKRYEHIAYPGSLRSELVRVRDYCRENDIHLVFVITPQHVDAQKLVGKEGVTVDYAQFKQDIASLGPTLDCDIPSTITEDRGNYLDPFHLTDRAAKRLVQDIWTGQYQWCHRLPTQQSKAAAGNGAS